MYSREELFYSSFNGVPKHSKTDYEMLNKLTIADILKSSTAKKKKMQIPDDDDFVKNMIKIEHKKQKQ